MDIGFVWDENKYQSVQQKHGVQFYEVVSAFDDSDGCEFPDPEGHEERWMLIARSTGGRELAIVFSEEDLPVYRLITAFDVDEGLRDEYYKRGGI